MANELKIFKDSKMWSIYADEAEMDNYVMAIESFYKEKDIGQRYDISKPFLLQEPNTSIVHKMYCITVIAPEDDMNVLCKSLGLVNC